MLCRDYSHQFKNGLPEFLTSLVHVVLYICILNIIWIVDSLSLSDTLISGKWTVVIGKLTLFTDSNL